MEVDKEVQNEDVAKYYLKIIKKHSPFDKYLIGEKVGIFGTNGTGTQVYIWNLDKWGTAFSLEWKYGMDGGSSFHQGGIYIRSGRIRSRPGQISKMVCGLHWYSLHFAINVSLVIYKKVLRNLCLNLSSLSLQITT